MAKAKTPRNKPAAKKMPTGQMPMNKMPNKMPAKMPKMPGRMGK